MERSFLLVILGTIQIYSDTRHTCCRESEDSAGLIEPEGGVEQFAPVHQRCANARLYMYS
jgi:hypothetical protein